MKVRDWMTPNPITTTLGVSIVEVRQLMARHGIRSMPVVSGDQLLGLVTDRDVRDALPSAFEYSSATQRDMSSKARRVTVDHIMSIKTVQVAPEDSLKRAMLLLLVYDLEGLPVTEHGRIVGMITRTDILRASVGIRAPGHRSEHHVEGEPAREAPLVSDAIVEVVEHRRRQRRTVTHVVRHAPAS